MAPKRKRKVVGVVRTTTRKVVRETVQVSVIDNNDTAGTDEAQTQSLPYFEPETEELQPQEEEEGIGLGTEEALDLVGAGGSSPPPTTRRMSTRRTIIIEDKIPEGVIGTKLRVPVEQPAAAPKGTEAQGEEKAEEQIKEKPRSPEEEEQEMGKSSEDQSTEGEEVGPELETEEEALPDEARGKHEAPKDEAPEKPEVEKAEGGDGEKKRGRRTRAGSRRKRSREEGNEEYRRYVFKVLKQVHPGMRISGMAMTVLNGYMNDMFERLADEAAKLSRYTGRLTLSSREIQGAVRLVLPGELGRHAIAEGAKAVSNYMSHDAA